MNETNEFEQFFCPVVCVALVENGASQRDVLMLLSVRTELKRHREYFMEYNLIWKVKKETFQKHIKKIKKLHLIGEITKSIDLSNLWYFHCDNLNHPISSFGNLTYFQCNSFKHPVSSFGNLTHFQCNNFNHSILNFGNLTHFQCDRFNQPVSNFGNLTHFECYYLNVKVHRHIIYIKFNAHPY